jgi:hypothetical protein
MTAQLLAHQNNFPFRAAPSRVKAESLAINARHVLTKDFRNHLEQIPNWHRCFWPATRPCQHFVGKNARLTAQSDRFGNF